MNDQQTKTRIEAFKKEYEELCMKHGLCFLVQLEEDREYDYDDPPKLACVHIISIDDENGILEQDYEVVDGESRLGPF